MLPCADENVSQSSRAATTSAEGAIGKELDRHADAGADRHGADQHEDRAGDGSRRQEAAELRAFGHARFIRDAYEELYDARVADVRQLVRRRTRAGLVGALLDSHYLRNNSFCNKINKHIIFNFGVTNSP